MTPEIRGAGANRPRVRNGLFVKQMHDNGSPFAEEAASHVFKALGVPHIPVRAVDDDVAVSRFRPDVIPLHDLKPEHLDRARVHLHDPNHVGPTYLAEWLLNADDRHAGNYVWSPTDGVMSIDHGISFHPMNKLYPQLLRGEDPNEIPEHRMVGTPERRSIFGPSMSALSGAIGRSGKNYREFIMDHIPDATIQRALAHEKELLEAARHGTQVLPPEERAEAVRAMQLKLQALRDHRGPLSLFHLNDLTDKVWGVK